MPKKLFISYRSSDAAKVDRIARDLALLRQEDGTPPFETWQDKHNLPPASPNWWSAIVDAIIDCDLFVFHISHASLQSVVCLAELDYAHKRNRPIIPVVLDGEYILHAESGKYDLPKATWALVPGWLAKQQLLFYAGAEFYSKFQAAVALFGRMNLPDIYAPRPLKPDSDGYSSNHAEYAAACDYAERLALAEAENHFQTLLNDRDYAAIAPQWLEMIRRYAELIQLDERRNAFMFKKKWTEYRALYPKDFLDGMFDPKHFAGDSAPQSSGNDETPAPPTRELVVAAEPAPADELDELDEDERAPVAADMPPVETDSQTWFMEGGALSVESDPPPQPPLPDGLIAVDQADADNAPPIWVPAERSAEVTAILVPSSESNGGSSDTPVSAPTTESLPEQPTAFWRLEDDISARPPIPRPISRRWLAFAAAAVSLVVLVVLALNGARSMTGAIVPTSTIRAIVPTSTIRVVVPTSTIRAIVPTDNPTPLRFTGTAVTRNADWQSSIEQYQRGFNGVWMVLVPPGCFEMGNDPNAYDGSTLGVVDGGRQCFDAPFWIDQTEVTQTDFERLGGVKANANAFSGAQRPLESITWFEARNFCARRGARLPTEAEWEYAARGPDQWLYPWGNDWNSDNAVWSGNSNQQTANVGSRPAGQSWVGALDMSGNVWEWVNSLYLPYPYDRSQENDSNTNSLRVLRGGSWSGYNTGYLRAGYRLRYYPDSGVSRLGFRCARSA